MRSSVISEEAYCSPWNLTTQEEKFKLLNEQQHRKPTHRTYSARAAARRKSPPTLPPLPPGGFAPPCVCITNNHTETSRDFCTPRISSKGHQSRLNVSLPRIQSTYDPPWDMLINQLRRRSLQKMPTTCSLNSSGIYSDEETTTVSIDRYFWYHYAMSRRQAESILESRLSGSFLVRQSESGNQNDYSLSIKTVTGCMHMRISYSDGFYVLGECSRPFSNVSSMIDYFTHTSVPIRGATHIKLGTPVSRWEVLSSSLANEGLL